ncbi:ATP-binding cassette sub-family A member 3-like [Scaptodrosophila lebanonensis]|uniref:ATP-binding cassette sub-family A member 3-like n=1 Tax=Drosophila lebanonensis TaxID=7225 RepID=A0A6J2T8Q8_DROLE|nr:ATP-binding cassette sub-family A member 3-like [Scaptodrosophila lebanonensis]
MSSEDLSEFEPKGISNCQKLKLLLWKNWILQWSGKLQIVLTILLVVVLLLLIMLLRIFVKPEVVPETRFPTITIDNLEVYLKSVPKGIIFIHDNGTFNMPKHVLCYTPKSTTNDGIISETVKLLKLNGSRPYNTSEHLEFDVVKHNYIAGVVFESTNVGKDGGKIPQILKYSLRFPSELRTNNQLLTWMTDQVFPQIDSVGPRNRDNNTGGSPVGYIMEGFLPIQNAVTMSWLKLATDSKVASLPKVQLRRFPYNTYDDDVLIPLLGGMLPLWLLFCFIYPCAMITKYVATEKEAQLKEIMKLLDLHNWIHWLAWFIKSYVVLMVVAIIVTLMLLLGIFAPPILTYSSFFPMIFFFHFYVVSCVCFSFMVAVFFNRASSATAIMVIWCFASFIPFSYVNSFYHEIGIAPKLITCVVFTNTALGLGVRTILAFEGSGEGLRFSNMFSRVSADDSFSLFYVIAMLMLSSVIYMIICLYVEMIHPGRYGIARKWYFPFQRNFLYPLLGFSAVSRDSESSFDEPCSCPTTQSEHAVEQVGIQICNLQKRFGNHIAVQSLSFNLYRDEITVLLGHNGAGKTTTIQMLTGIIPPTAGTAFINGCDIRTQLDCARSSMGICPQHNVLFGDMSVRNHIKFFGRLKGMEGHELKRELKKYMEIMDLEKKQRTAARKLSGGMKRKLSLCCALCGNTRTVLCDEPSSGLDVAARRYLWDLLQAEKMGRTILLTTHYMDEADALADRIAIMCNGQLQCYDTSFNLKNTYDSGYRLVCIKQEGCNVEKVTAYLRKYISNIKLENEVGMDLTYRLPASKSAVYADMLSGLESKSKKLHLSGYGISAASLEDVFEKTGAEKSRNPGGQQLDEGEHATNKSIQLRFSGGRENGIFNEDVYESNSRTRCRMRWRAMLRKKVLTTKRSLWILVMQLLLPLLFMVMTLSITMNLDPFPKLLPLDISFNIYPDAYVVLENKTGKETGGIATAYAKHVEGNSGKLLNTNGASFEDYILGAAKEDRTGVDRTYIAGATISEKNLTVWLNNKPYHTAPLTLNILHNAMARHFLGPKASIRVTNYPLPYSQDTVQKRTQTADFGGLNIAMNLTMCMSFVIAFFVIPVIKEREARAKLLQFLTGVDVYLYWISHLLWDFAIFVLCSLITVITIVLYQEPGYSTLSEIIRNLFLLLMFGFAAIPFAYMLAGWSSESAAGYIRTSLLGAIGGLVLFFFHYSFVMANKQSIANIVGPVFRLLPHFCLLYGMNSLYENYKVRNRCSAPYIEKLTNGNPCSMIPLCCDIPGYFGFTKPGIGTEIIYLFLEGILLFLLLLILDSKRCTGFRDFFNGVFSIICCNYSNRAEGGQDSANNNNDVDVELEREIITNMTEDDRKNMPLVVDRICKKYGGFTPVKELSFSVARSECFGLLGVNGAGKSTTFKMLTGDVSITKGNAYVDGLSVRKQMHKVYDHIGYCPQYDALLGELTGNETMRLYCMLRGVHQRYINNVCNDLASELGFIKHIDKPIKNYSGGNKRKLSVAIALITDPSILYLDEPSAGMDPSARRQMWKLLATIRDMGKGIVLTSHCMEEVEALCTRIAIMVDGNFKCIGSIQSIKNKYSKGLVLKITVARGSPAMSRSSQRRSTSNQLRSPSSQRMSTLEGSSSQHRSTSTQRMSAMGARSSNRASTSAGQKEFSCDRCGDNVTLVKIFIKQHLPDSVLQKEFRTQLTYFVPKEDTNLSKIFHLIESNRAKLNLEDYSITQTTLDEIFIEFGKKKQK